MSSLLNQLMNAHQVLQRAAAAFALSWKGKRLALQMAAPARRSMAVLLMAIALLPSTLHAEKIHVYLVGGQSNADGRAPNNDLPAELNGSQSDIPFYWGKGTSNSHSSPSQITLMYDFLQPGNSRTNQFGPEITFGRAMADYHAARGEKVAIIKYAQGDTNLFSQWKAGGDTTTSGDGDVYKIFQYVVEHGMETIQSDENLNGNSPSPRGDFGTTGTLELCLEGMIWMQGEADTHAERSLVFEDNLRGFIADIRATYGSDLPFVIGQLSSNQTALNSTYLDRVSSAQAAVAAESPYTGLVNTDDFELKSDNLHFSGAGQQALGYAFAEQMQEMRVPEPSGAAIALGASLAFCAGHRWRRTRCRRSLLHCCGAR
ncbi:sialate O-acetylesterase [Aeoliella mucimassa]|uniref:Sialate O-acetylesterase domain-containing protein n=1 Tax=Aeoliella mucimassa TaxID=2527972 RepID=A0A518AJX4_9BACT|nr:sialate O-acetylesterase [Aeoliella mucimassa]QDU55028.1 hypothetical protein Pan181_12140 [Aeoliella mucimassa]